MIEEKHFQQLEALFLSAPINKTWYPDFRIQIRDKESEILGQVSPQTFHALGAMHGSVVFKWLDDAAYFAAASTEKDFFLLTKQFDIQLLRPVSAGIIRAVGQWEEASEREIKASATLWNDQNKPIGKGVGIFVRSKYPLGPIFQQLC